MICSSTSPALSLERWPCRLRMRCFKLQGRRGFSCNIFTSWLVSSSRTLAGADALDDQFGGVAEVGEKADVARAGAQEKTDRVAGVVRNGKVSTVTSPTSKESPVTKMRASIRICNWPRWLPGQAIAINGQMQVRRPG